MTLPGWAAASILSFTVVGTYLYWLWVFLVPCVVVYLLLVVDGARQGWGRGLQLVLCGATAGGGRRIATGWACWCWRGRDCKLGEQGGILARGLVCEKKVAASSVVLWPQDHFYV